ncbi:MAG TPA: acetoacetate--CoA ligase, partial [Anaerolineae bacterium]|nr:acetoacetate--CoA ligase [Anaerolineae bacterium]
MTTLREGDLLWQPSESDIEKANLTAYMRWLRAERGLDFADYPALWHWSVTEIEAFWASLVDYFGIVYSQPWTAVLARRVMPGATWFDGMRLNYAENIFAKMTADRPMMVFKNEQNAPVEISWQTVYAKVNRLVAVLRGMGVTQGDRVVAYMPNIPETIIALLATASIGAIWSSCSPDFGSRSVLDRFVQIEPKVLLAVDGYWYGGKKFDRRKVLAQLQAALPTVQQTILVPQLDTSLDGLRDTVLWDVVLDSAEPPTKIPFTQLPFDHPLWVLYSSGTTGLPKPIVQGQGGILLEHAKATTLHNDLKPGDRFFWYSSTGWMMWNYLVGSLLTGATIVLYDGSPAYPDIGTTFALAEQVGVTYFGTSAAFISACGKAGIQPNQQYDLSKIRAVGSTGSPLSVDGFQWVYEHINRRLALESLSGGTDLCTAFVGGARIRPIYVGELQGASLGAKVQAFDEAGQAVFDQVGELVISEPMPSMPLYFWGDEGDKRYRASYFAMYPNIWRHGDWIQFNQRGG